MSHNYKKCVNGTHDNVAYNHVFDIFVKDNSKYEKMMYRRMLIGTCTFFYLKLFRFLQNLKLKHNKLSSIKVLELFEVFFKLTLIIFCKQYLYKECLFYLRIVL